MEKEVKIRAGLRRTTEQPGLKTTWFVPHFTLVLSGRVFACFSSVVGRGEEMRTAQHSWLDVKKFTLVSNNIVLLLLLILYCIIN